MTDAELAKKLISLAQLDIDAIEAYKQALSNIEDEIIFAALKDFQEDHKRHVRELTTEIERLGDNPPDDKDVKGFLIEGFTAIRSLTGTEGALKAMQGNEELTTKTYHAALESDLPEPIKALVEKNYADEQRHLAYIKKALEDLKKD